MKKLSLASLLIIISISLFSQKRDVIYLWPGKVPGELNEKGKPVFAPSKNNNVLRIAIITQHQPQLRDIKLKFH